MNQKVSVVLAVFNEEENLGPCLKSVEGLAFEIVIVDGGSTDNTVDIAKRFEAKVIHSDNPQVFHINKNKAIEAAKGDWVLQLDADETVSRELSMEIKEVISNKDEFNGYWIPRRNFFLGRFLSKGGQYPDYTLRLYRNGKGRLPAKDVHEQAVVEGKVGFLKNDLIHIKDKTFEIYLKKLNIYTSLIATQMKQKGVKNSLQVFIDYVLIKPVWWFLKTYFIHKGFVDGFAGFIFSLFSSLRFPISFFKFVIDKGERK